VIKARLFGVKETGGKIEALVERILDARTVHAQVRASKSPPPGTRIRLADAFDVTVGERFGEFYTLHSPPTPSNCWSTAACRCRPTSTTKPTPTTRPATRPSMPGTRRRRRPTAGLHFDQPCWPGWPRAASSKPS
jgi:S-adenosylmethionine:tRNA ribosyltransferase-isomerase